MRYDNKYRDMYRKNYVEFFNDTCNKKEPPLQDYSTLVHYGYRIAHGINIIHEEQGGIAADPVMRWTVNDYSNSLKNVFVMWDILLKNRAFQEGAVEFYIDSGCVEEEIEDSDGVPYDSLYFRDRSKPEYWIEDMHERALKPVYQNVLFGDGSVVDEHIREYSIRLISLTDAVAEFEVLKRDGGRGEAKRVAYAKLEKGKPLHSSPENLIRYYIENPDARDHGDYGLLNIHTRYGDIALEKYAEILECMSDFGWLLSLKMEFELKTGQDVVDLIESQEFQSELPAAWAFGIRMDYFGERADLIAMHKYCHNAGDPSCLQTRRFCEPMGKRTQACLLF